MHKLSEWKIISDVDFLFLRLNRHHHLNSIIKEHLDCFIQHDTWNIVDATLKNE